MPMGRGFPFLKQSFINKLFFNNTKSGSFKNFKIIVGFVNISAFKGKEF